MRTDGQIIICTLAACKCSSVNKSLIVDGNDVTVSYRTILYSYSSCLLILNLLQFFLNLFVGNFYRLCLILKTLILAKSYFRLNCYSCSKDEGLALLDLCYVDLWLRSDY